MHSFLRNLLGGLRLALPLPVKQKHFVFNEQQAALFLILGVLLDSSSDWFNALPARQLNPYGVTHLLSLYFATLISLYLITALHRQSKNLGQLVLLTYASYPLILLVDEITASWFLEYLDNVTLWVLIGCIWAWSLIILIRAIRLTLTTTWPRTLTSAGLYGAITAVAVFTLPSQPLWYGNVETIQDARRQSLNIENLYYRQPPMLDNALELIQPGDPKKTELYFLGFAPDSRQDVFLKESTYVQDFFDQRFNARDRSLLLINHWDTYEHEPLANNHNLAAALKGYALLMNEDDILFLYLASHGSKTYELSVEFSSMQFNWLPAQKLSQLINFSGIKWKSLVLLK